MNMLRGLRVRELCIFCTANDCGSLSFMLAESSEAGPSTLRVEFMPCQEITCAPWPEYFAIGESEFARKFCALSSNIAGFRAIARIVHETTPRASRIQRQLLVLLAERCEQREEELEACKRHMSLVETGVVNESLLDLVQEVFRIGLYVWEFRTSTSQYVVARAPLAVLVQPRKIGHLLTIEGEYVLLEPNRTYVAHKRKRIQIVQKVTCLVEAESIAEDSDDNSHDGCDSGADDNFDAEYGHQDDFNRDCFDHE